MSTLSIVLDELRPIVQRGATLRSADRSRLSYVVMLYTRYTPNRHDTDQHLIDVAEAWITHHLTNRFTE